MKKEFKPLSYEAKWRKKWEEEKVYEISNPVNDGKPKYYCLDMFPYPSGEGLHVGHWRGYVLSDVWSRYKISQGYNVLHPMGWDNFGLPAENDAIKKGIHPRISTSKNIENMRRQLKEIGCTYDWSREIDTTHPEYYKWTQFIFLKMFERGLAYQKEQPVNWCGTCKVVLANEEVEGGKCERCGGGDIEKRSINQWMLKITEYSERLLSDLDDLDWPEKVKEMQRNWIGKSQGASVLFEAQLNDGTTQDIEVYTTRPDTLFGATFMVIAPEHPMVKKLVTPGQEGGVAEYVKSSQLLSNIERQIDKEKTGVFTGAYAVNPVNGDKVQIWVSGYVLMDYGTGAIMAVPAHDDRDFEFAKKFDIPIIEVIYSEKALRNDDGSLKAAHIDDGKLINSDFLNGMSVSDAKEAIIEKLEKTGKGKSKINYKLRDWIFARQRYWGEPIPIIHCEKCAAVAVPYDQLPVTLPDVESYKATDDGTSPLSRVPEWINTECPKCGGPAKRETDTMPQWAGSSWYFLRYPDRFNNEELLSKKVQKEWLPVDMYVGGIEHAVLHLLYARFWTKVLYDCEIVDFTEPFTRLFNQGMVCRRAHRCEPCNRWIYDTDIEEQFANAERFCPDCGSQLKISLEKMSKSKGNGINPDVLVNHYGTDTLRLYELFTGDPSMDSEWNDDGIKACFNLLRKGWDIVSDSAQAETSSEQAQRAIHKLIKNITSRIESFKFNTAVSAFMEFVNEAGPIKNEFAKSELEKFIILIAPFAPHFAEEIWHNTLGNEGHVFHQEFPVADEKYLISSTQEITIHFNGKMRFKIEVPVDCSEEELYQMIEKNPLFDKYKGELSVVKKIRVPGKLVNYIIK